MDMYPDVVTNCRLGNARFKIYAFRKLSKTECEFAVTQFMRGRRLRSIPRKGTFKIFTAIGSIE